MQVVNFRFSKKATKSWQKYLTFSSLVNLKSILRFSWFFMIVRKSELYLHFFKMKVSKIILETLEFWSVHQIQQRILILRISRTNQIGFKEIISKQTRLVLIGQDCFDETKNKKTCKQTRLNLKNSWNETHSSLFDPVNS